MSYSTVTATLNYTGQPNVSTTLVSSDAPTAQAVVQNIAKYGGFWTNSSATSGQDTFYPSSAILFLRIS